MPLKGPRIKRIRRVGTPLPGLTRKAPEDSQATTSGGRKPRRRSVYRRRLEEKQKLRWNYGISERQLRRYFADARRGAEPAGTALLALLERRLDNVVFRLGLAPTIPAARQLVAHGHILVDGRRVDRPGQALTPGSTVAVRARARAIPAIRDAAAAGPEVRLPGYLARDPADPFTGRVVGEPVRADVPFIVDEAAIIEFYAR
ncbi:MAG TPA: 30S ribosomal protein S4 [Longimicrobiales bacterium]|nr:30S ribosomal protein S4 [Longimicrobiales bacterium]